MTPEQITAEAIRIAGDRAISQTITKNTLMLTCDTTAIAEQLVADLNAGGIKARVHDRFPCVAVVSRRPHQQFHIVPSARRRFYLPRFYGEKGER
jgi:hypothetical protein